jgi:glycosyltransferase involved in cell wall biosynthesis
MNKIPFVTVIVCTYNGEKHIKDCLDALTKQDYPKDKYETIVVDDGSTDRTDEIVSKYPVKIIKHRKNLGISSARNTGLRNANGTVVAYTDDDCIPKTSWLKNLIKFYTDDVIAVGGLTIPFSTKTIMEKYMAEIGYGNPTPLEFRKSKNPLYRFYIYLKDMFWQITTNEKNPIQVGSIYTLNASFIKKILEEAGEWEEDLNSSEDSEMCEKFNKKFKNKKILFTKKAVVIHKHRTSFIYFLKQTFKRSEDTLKCYLKYNKIPPVFPLPLFILLLIFIIGYFNILLGFLTLIISPHFFYLWWSIKFFSKLKLYYLVFPYMQFSLELAATLGILKGFVRLKLEK